MSIQVESQHGGEFLLSEGNGTQSRDAATLISGQNLTDGAVLGQITASGKFTAFDPVGGDGSQNAAALLLGDKDASAADEAIAIVSRLAEVKLDKLHWKAGVTSNQQAAALVQLAAKFIISRS